jgi:hypothetical protein
MLLECPGQAIACLDLKYNPSIASPECIQPSVKQQPMSKLSLVLALLPSAASTALYPLSRVQTASDVLAPAIG